VIKRAIQNEETRNDETHLLRGLGNRRRRRLENRRPKPDRKDQQQRNNNQTDKLKEAKEI
jgi:hypothetical protein